MKGRIKSIIWGICFLIVGFGLLGDWLSWWGGFHFGDVLGQCWWAVLLLLFGITSMVESVNAGSLIFTAVGAVCIAFCFLEDADVFRLLLPGIAIIIGLCLIFGKKTKPGSGGPNAASRPPESAYTACFSGEHVNLRGMELKNGFKATAVFGGVDIDLRGTVISEDITLKLTAVFGGIDVFAPENANIKTVGSSFLGGCENKTVHIEGGSTVTIEYTCVFGGIEIK